MRILFVNKYLYPCGGAEIYMFKLGEYLKSLGHQIEYFGMNDERNIVGNSLEIYTENMEFKGDSKRIVNPLRLIYSKDARKKISTLMNHFHPDIVHINNINYQITPSIIFEIKKHKVPIVQTVHDSQIACPNHRLYIESKKKVCTKCINGNYKQCIKHRCIHGSLLQSVLGACEAYLYHLTKVYDLIDLYITPSKFIQNILVVNGIDKNKTKVMYNFAEEKMISIDKVHNKSYVLYFGRLSVEKGIQTLIDVCKELPDINFVFAGEGPLKSELQNIKNISYVGFKNGDELNELIMNATCSVYPSEWYENCPLSVIESIMLGTPVVGSDMGGINELIRNSYTGKIYKAGDKSALKLAIQELWYRENELKFLKENCLKENRFNFATYTENLINLYNELMSGELK